MAIAAASAVPRRRLTVADRRRELIEAALVLFSARPAETVSLDDVAREAGVSRALAYRYFGGRAELYVEALRTAADRFLAELDPPHDETPLTRIVAAVHRYFNLVEEHATGYQTLMRGDPASHSGAVGEIVSEVRGGVFGRLVEGMGRTEVSAELRLALQTWMAGTEAAALDWLEHRDLERQYVEDFALEQLYAALTRTAATDREVSQFLEGLLPRLDSNQKPFG